MHAESAFGLESSFSGGAAGHTPEAEPRKSGVGELWGDLNEILGHKKVEYDDYNKSYKDLSNRHTRGILR